MSTSIEVSLTRGFVAIVDRDDFGLIARHSWSATSSKTKKQVYAGASIWYGPGCNRYMLMHRLILNAPPEVLVDHIDGDGLNNRRSNLRLSNQSQNLCNSGIRPSNTSGFKGVPFIAARGRWRAQIGKNNEKFHLGLFDTPEEAAKAYDAAAQELHGEFAWLNFALEDMERRNEHRNTHTDAVCR